MTTLSIENISKKFGDVEILQSVNLHVEDNGFLVLLGPSGCGKSTLLSIIAGLESETAGRILIDGNEITGIEPKDRDIAMVFQSYALYPSMNVERNITFSMEVRGIPKEERRVAARKAAGALQIGHLLDRKPSQLSGGQRQRVAIGRALVRAPKVFLFDEPLSNLDAQLRLETRTFIKRLHQDLGATSVYVTHDQTEAMTLATKIAVMSKGGVAQIGTPSEIYNRPADVQVARLVGSPPINLIPGRITLDEGRATIALAGLAKETLLRPERRADLSPLVGKEVLVGIRPDRLVVQQGHSFGQIEARVDLVEETGTDVLLYLQSGSQILTARTGVGPRHMPQSIVQLSFREEDMILFDAETQKSI